VTGASWVDIEAILEHRASDTTPRARRDEWIAAGVFEQLKDEALAAFDRIIGLDLDDVALDGSVHKALRRRGNGPEPYGPSQVGLEVVRRLGASRHPDRVGHRRRQPMWAHAGEFVAPVRTGPAEDEEVLMVDASKKPAAKKKTAAVRRPKRCYVPDCEAEVYHAVCATSTGRVGASWLTTADRRQPGVHR
jgi:hypothetical protein